jgi:hypothetical protein
VAASEEPVADEAAPAAPAAPKPDAAPSPSPDAPKPATEAPATPAAEAPKKWAGRYETPEALESGYTEIQRERGELLEAKKRLEGLLDAALARPVADAAPPGDGARPAVSPTTRNLVELVSRAAVGDDSVTDETLLSAFAAALAEQPVLRDKIGGHALAELNGELAARQRIDEFRGGFFSKYPGAKRVKEPILRTIGTEVEARLYPDLRGPLPREGWEKLMDGIADELRGLGLDPTKGDDPTAPAASAAPAPAREVPRGVRSEGGGGGPAPTAKLTGQAAELADVFQTG